MKLLLTNDDGINSDALLAIATALSANYELFIAAPDSQRSGAAHSITLNTTLTAKKVQLHGLESVTAYSVTGTPVDCVKLAIGNLGATPDIVVSGINAGANIGRATLYSGTVGAAEEGIAMGIPSIALSICNHRPKHLESAVAWGVRAVDFYAHCIKNRIVSNNIMFNVNAPDLPLSEIKGARLVRLGETTFAVKYIETEPLVFGIPHWEDTHNPSEDTDENAIEAGYVALTPMCVSKCADAFLDILRQMRDSVWK